MNMKRYNNKGLGKIAPLYERRSYVERDSFIFYRSFYEAIKEIPEQEQLSVYKAITEYALNQEEIEITGTSKAIFTLVKPQLDANFQKYLNGKKAKRKQNKSKR